MMKKIILLLIVLTFITFQNQAQTVTDFDGNVYETVIIGTQVWMKQNLKVTHYNNGTPIPKVSDNSQWSNLTTGARCYYNNDSSANNPVYGALYNWYVVNDTNKICPTGWHIPTNTEWETVEAFLGGSNVAGGEMKESGTVHWSTPNIGATNSSGFTGIPGGMRDPNNNNFSTIGENGLWWTSTELDVSRAWSTYLWYLYTGVDHNPTTKKYGLSIRCVKDIGTGLEDNNYLEELKIYPNPFVDYMNIEYFVIGSKYVVIEMTDVFGRNIYSLPRALESGRQIKHINGIDINPGVYFLKLNIGNEIKILKVIK